MSRNGSVFDYPTIRDLPIDRTKYVNVGSSETAFRMEQTEQTAMARRRFLSQLLGLPFLTLGAKAQESKKVLKIMMRSSWGTDDPTRASFVFAHALALSDAGHEVQI